MRCVPAALLLLTIAFTGGCAPDETDASATVRRDTLPEGVVRVRHATLPMTGAPVVEADLRLGAVDGDPNLAFGDVRSVEAGPDGTLYVLDHQASEVRAFDSDGRFVRRVARKGEGPGEISQANGMVLARDGTLWIQDHAKWTMIGVSTAPDAAGEEVGRVPMHVRSYGYVWNGTMDDRGRFWKPQSHSDAERVYPPPEGLTEGSWRLYYKWYDPATEESDSLFMGDHVSRSFAFSPRPGAWGFRGIPFEPRAATVVDPAGGFWQSDMKSYRVARLGEEGDTILLIEADIPPAPVTAEDRSAYVEAAAERGPDERRVAEEMAGLMPPIKPVLESLGLDDRGRLWVRRLVPDGEMPLYDVFTSDGDLAGTLRLGFEPAPGHSLRIRDGQIYTVVRDSLDVPFVVRAPLPEWLAGG